MVLHMNTKLPSDALTTRTHPAKITAIIGAAALAVALGLTGGSAWAAHNANTADAPRAVAVAEIPVNVPMTLSPSSVEGSQEVDAAQTAAVAAQAAALAASHQEQSADGPIKCAAGYTANAVDAAGNESNCSKNGPGNKPCVAYNDDNVCTAYEE